MPEISTLIELKRRVQKNLGIYMSPPNRLTEVHSFTALIVPHIKRLQNDHTKYIDEYKVLHFHTALPVEQLS